MIFEKIHRELYLDILKILHISYISLGTIYHK